VQRGRFVGKATSVLKKLLRPLAAGAGITGAVAALNRGLRERSELPHNHLGGVQHRWQWRGYDIFATELGTGPLVILVHGISAGASSYEFRKLAPLLAERHRVVAFDMLGCGLSDKPNLPYSAELFVEQIVDALREFGTEPTTVIGSSLGAAFAIRATARASDRITKLVTIAPTGLGGVLDAAPSPVQSALGTVIRTPIAGEAMFNALVSGPSLRLFLTRQAYGDAASVTAEVLAHYSAVTHQPGARYVPAAFLSGALTCNVARDLPFVEAPVLVVWGERAATVNPASNAREYVSLARSATLATFAHSALLPHEEEPAAVNAAIEAFLEPPIT